jgi:cytidine deaminase
VKKTTIDKNVLKDAIKIAINTYQNAYDPLTNYAVGACIITDDDKLFGGCNVQSVISGLGSCAESCAIFHSISHRNYNFKGIVVASKKAISPCGACLQYLNEFAQVSGHDIRIISVDLSGTIKKDTTLYSTIKHLYGPADGNKDISRYRAKIRRN